MSQLNKVVIQLLIVKLLVVSSAFGNTFYKRQAEQLPEGTDWEQVGDRFFSEWMDKATWEDAQNACLKMNATLVVDNDPKVKAYLTDWGKFLNHVLSIGNLLFLFQHRPT